MSYAQDFFLRKPAPTLADVDAYLAGLKKTIAELRAKPLQSTAELQHRLSNHILTAEDELRIFENRRASFVAAGQGA